jgi:cyclopropane fatty-acyl-phospholipid synthase-like methyltransferase
MRSLLLGLVSLGLLKKRGIYYSNSVVASMALTRHSRQNIISIIKWQHFINYRPMYSFYDAIKQNTNVGLKEITGTESTLYERLAHTPELETIFQDAMQSISVQANDMLARFVDFSGVRHLVDVGGGNGSNIITLARHNPHLKASVFDSPSVCAIAREHIKKTQLQDRLGAAEGDCFTTPFPKEADCIMFCHFFTIWSEERNRALLKKAFDSLPKGGRVVVFNMMQRNDESGPLSSSMGSPYFLTLATGEGMLYTWKEYETWMREAGFATVKTQILPRDHGVVIGIKD